MAYIPLRLTTDGDNGRRLASIAPEPYRPRTWSYMTTDAAATVRVASYFTDAFYRGMRAGDVVRVVTVTGTWPSVTVTAFTNCVVMTCTASAGADLSDGTVTSVTNSD